MPKSKKKKRQDFQKVKLKVGKRLPKGDNVTNLSFKTRQIQLTQKIKDDDGQGFVTKKKQSVQDLLRQCDHHSSSSRLSAVMGLKELWHSGPAELMVLTNAYGYAAVLKKLAGLLIDSEATVRHAVVNLFKVILHKITKDPSSPSSGAPSERLLGGSLFAHLHAFVCCALNHTHEDVRLDALLLYDAMLDACPALLVRQTGALLRNLAGLLAVPPQGHVGARGDKVTQRLSLNPESRLPVAQFRVRVLSRIKRTLVAATSEKLLSQTSNKNNPTQRPVWSLHDDYYERKNVQNTAILSSWAVNRFSILADSGSQELDDYITNPKSLMSFINQTVPVLIQCWKEARVDNDSQHEAVSVLTSSAVEVISLAVSIIQLLFTLALSDSADSGDKQQNTTPLVPPGELSINFQLGLEQLMMSGFPYSAQVEASSGKKKSNKKTKDTSLNTEAALQASLKTLNLGICYVMTSFCADHKFKLCPKWAKKIKLFIITSIKEMPNVDQCKTIVRIMKNAFFNPHTTESFSKIYKVAMKWFLKLSPKSQQKKILFNAFAEMGRRWDGWSKDRHELDCIYQHQECPEVEETLLTFFNSLPKLAVSAHAVADQSWLLRLLDLMGHGHVMLHCQPFGDTLSQVLDPSKGFLTSPCEAVQQRVLYLLSHGVSLSRDQLRLLLLVLRGNNGVTGGATSPMDGGDSKMSEDGISGKVSGGKDSVMADGGTGVATSASDGDNEMVSMGVDVGIAGVVTDASPSHLVLARKSNSCVARALHALFAGLRASVPMDDQVAFNYMSKEQHTLLSDFLRFLFSLQIGFTGEELDHITPANPDSSVKYSWRNINMAVTEAQWDRHVEIVDVVTKQVARFNLPPLLDEGIKKSFTFIPNFEHFWIQTFTSRASMPVISVLGLAHLILHASHPHLPETLPPSLLSLAASSIAATLATLHVPAAQPGGQVPSGLVWKVKAELTRVLAETSATSGLLAQVTEALRLRAEDDTGVSAIEKQSAKSAMDFLLTDERLRQRLQA